MGIVNFSPKQDGTGDPSPTNVRPIHPGLTIDGIGDIYGGHVDFDTGEVVSEWTQVDLGDYDWTAKDTSGNYNYFYTNSLASSVLYDVRNGHTVMWYVSALNSVANISRTSMGAKADNNLFTITQAGVRGIFVVRNDECSTPEEFKTWVSGIKVVYPIATPVTYSLTASQLTQAYNQLVPVSTVMLERRRRMIAGCDPEVPPQYKRVEYIQAKNVAYIATNYIPTRYDEFDVEFMIDSYPSSFISLFSAGTDTYQLVYLLSDSETGYSYLRYFSTGASGVHLNLLLDTWYRLTLSANGLMSVNGTSRNYSYENEVSGNNNNMYIFRRRDTNNPFIGKLKSFKVTNNGTLKLNLVPCVRISDDVAGVYDTVSKTFYPSASTAEAFTPGRTMY